MQPSLARLADIAHAIKLDAFLLTHLPTIRQLTGYFFNFEAGPSPFHLLPACLVAVPGGEACLIAADTETGPLSTVSPGIKTRLYVSYVCESPLDFARQFQRQLQEAIREFGLSEARLGIEPASLPAFVEQELRRSFPHLELIDVTREVTQLRLIKTPEEIESIRRAVHLCDVGQETLLTEAHAGLTELELFASVRAAMEKAAGKRFPLMADFVSGPRTEQTGGGPCARTIEEGDLILSDLTPCLDGYWGDTCHTVVAGNPSPLQSNMFQRVQEALTIGIQAMRPGVRASAIDRLMRQHLAPLGTYPHHGGHGLGVTYHEEPRIVPYNDLELEPGMIVALEPGVYRDGQGVRLEHVTVVTEYGCEILSRCQHRLSVL